MYPARCNIGDMMSDQELIDVITGHEGQSRYVYKDSRGYWTIAIGICVDERSGSGGLTLDEQYYLLQNRINSARAELHKFPFFINTDKIRQDLLIELVFNMGLPNLLSFDAIKLNWFADNQFKRCVEDFRSSKWATEIAKERLDDMMYRLEFGLYPKKT